MISKPMNLTPLIEKLTIIDKDLNTRRLDMSAPFAWAQRAFIKIIEEEYNAGKPVRIIVLKARQLGLSTISEGVIFNWGFIHPGANSLVIAHETEASQNLFEKSQLFWEAWPFNKCYTIHHASQKRMSWEETKSSLRIATARNERSGRSGTIQAVHASETAFWENPEPLIVGLRQSIPNRHGTIIIIESTANGMGNLFHELWDEAVDGTSEFIPIFFPWFKHPEYRLPLVTIDRIKPILDSTEKWLLVQGCTLEALEWRRYAIPNLCRGDESLFQQEYPATPEEAFRTSGRNVFPLDKLEECYYPLKGCRGFIHDEGGKYRFIADRTGPLTLFRWPSHDPELGHYFVSGDPSRTTMGDGASIQVLNRHTFEQVAVWHGRCDPIAFATEMAKLGYYFNTAELSPEIEGPGYATIGALIQMRYPRIWRHRWADKAPGKLSISYGWSTNYQRKHWAMGIVTSMLADKSLVIHDYITYKQMRDYVVLNDYGEMGNGTKTKSDDGSTGFDDAVMAFAINVVCIRSEGPDFTDLTETGVVQGEQFFGEDAQSAFHDPAGAYASL